MKQQLAIPALAQHSVVSIKEWTEARVALLQKEKQLTRLSDEIAAERRQLPWVKVDKNYVFNSANGERSLADLFDGRSQLCVKHFMFAPDWAEGCVGCSFECDHLDATLQHLHHHDVTVVAISRTTVEKIETFKKRMGWHFNWVSSLNNDFNYDFHVSFTPEQKAAGEVYYNYKQQPFMLEELSGFSIFYKDASGDVYHTYSTFGRGAEPVMGSYVILDMTPAGRNETGPNHDLTDWVRHHDRYEAKGHVNATGQFVYEGAGGGSGCGCAKDTATP